MVISRTAQLVALSLFGLGEKNEVTFRTPSRIGERCKIGLDELLEKGMITFENDRGAYIYKATSKIGNPFRDFKLPSQDDPNEQFPIVVSDKKKSEADDEQG